MGSFSERIQTGNDDGQKRVGGSYFPATGQNSTGNNNIACLRFSGASIPQGSTILTATITLHFSGGGNNAQTLTIVGIAEDNTASFSSDPTGRTQTSASVGWNVPGGEALGANVVSADFTSVIQEIVNRAGWASGNAIGILIKDNGSAFGHDWDSYETSTTLCALISITYAGISPSASLSPSASVSASPSASFPIPGPALKIAKSGFDVLNTHDPSKLIFDSQYGTLKYFTKQAVSISFDASIGDITAKGEYAHNLGYYPFCEVFVSVNGTPYEYCPFFGSGATISYSANVKITTDKITVYGEINGVSASVWTFDFLIFVFKNNLNL